MGVLADDGGNVMLLKKDASDDGQFYLYDGSGNIDTQFDTNSGGYSFVVGNFGIGTRIPGMKLDVSGDTRITGNLSVAGNFTGNQIHGEMWYHNHTATQINFAVQYANYTMWLDNAEELNGFSHETASGVGSNLTAQVGGLYSANWLAGGDGQNNHIYVGSIFVNGIAEDKCEDHKKMSAGEDITSLDGSCHIRLSTGDVLTIEISDWSGTGTGNYYFGNLNLVRIGS